MRIKYVPKIEGDHLGLYHPDTGTAEINTRRIGTQALVLAATMQKSRKEMQRIAIRIRRLVVYHELAHHMQYQTGRKFDEHVADRYANMRFWQDYHRPHEIPNWRRK